MSKLKILIYDSLLDIMHSKLEPPYGVAGPEPGWEPDQPRERSVGHGLSGRAEPAPQQDPHRARGRHPTQPPATLPQLQ